MADEVKFENGLKSKMDLQAPRVKANREALAVLMAALRAEEDTLRLGGGAKAADAQHSKGRLTVRERLKLLLDEGKHESADIGLLAPKLLLEGLLGSSGGRERVLVFLNLFAKEGLKLPADDPAPVRIAQLDGNAVHGADADLRVTDIAWRPAHSGISARSIRYRGVDFRCFSGIA